jgi:hypothetical protein
VIRYFGLTDAEHVEHFDEHAEAAKVRSASTEAWAPLPKRSSKRLFTRFPNSENFLEVIYEDVSPDDGVYSVSHQWTMNALKKSCKV